MTKPSLLPYLQSAAGKCRLAFLADPDPAEPVIAASQIISDSAPFSSIVKARFVTDYGATIQDVYALTQKDRYDFPVNDLYPVGNKDIDALWQRSFSLYSGGEGGGPPIVLADQLDEDGRILPFSSLFLCRKRGVYFHPPCPECGEALTLCEQDDLLVRSGLHPYSTSRFRYLFCRHCASDGEKALFYGYDGLGGSFPHLKNRLQLIDAFEALLSTGKHPESLPCSNCPERDPCYGPEKLWVGRIAPFSFFPFYMILFPGKLINAFDFFSLCAGAEYYEFKGWLIRNGKKNQSDHLDAFEGEIVDNKGLLEGSGRFFLEVLYLKLTFLQTLFRTLFSDKNLDRYPLMAPDLDRIWVSPSRSARSLPFFWNFDLVLMDFGNAAIYPALAHKPPVAFAAGHMGLIWLYLLLSNSRQTMRTVYTRLEEALRTDKPFDELFHDELEDVFAPENIFWRPAENPVDPEWRGLWEQAVSLGWDLFHTGSTPDAAFDPDAFSSAVRELLDAVRLEMFAPSRDAVSEKTEDARNEAIYEILSRLRSKWLRMAEAAETVSPPAAREAEADGIHEPEDQGDGAFDDDEWDEKTVVQQVAASPPEKEAESPAEDWEEKTVIQRPGVAPAASDRERQDAPDAEERQGGGEEVFDGGPSSESPGQEGAEEGWDDWDDKTIIQRPKASDSDSGKPTSVETTPEDDWDDQTVIQRVNQTPENAGSSPSQDDPEEADDWEDIPQTTIYRPSQKDRE